MDGYLDYENSLKRNPFNEKVNVSGLLFLSSLKASELCLNYFFEKIKKDVLPIFCDKEQ
jgi:hypothetical protein